MKAGLIAAALVVGSTGFAAAQGGSPGGGGAVGGTTGSPSGTGAAGQPGLSQQGNQGAGHSSLSTGTTGAAAVPPGERAGGSSTGAGEPGQARPR
ncbi:hypothetical protein DK419_18760 [Methylobacterium terrae]|uniref:Uncharacterized protein n=1 Tax=Methylobacterium terrae TaxID=2202827 RepID=A0A2U8WSC7_9HYPH|nr:hypothetical protein [Methylobacterium terrae]AWN48122.1 hypothetical protein DK419_18760 [Methylobacterium terrae]